MEGRAQSSEPRAVEGMDGARWWLRSAGACPSHAQFMRLLVQDVVAKVLGSQDVVPLPPWFTRGPTDVAAKVAARENAYDDNGDLGSSRTGCCKPGFWDPRLEGWTSTGVCIPGPILPGSGPEPSLPLRCRISKATTAALASFWRC